jgi:hypothetical protein
MVATCSAVPAREACEAERFGIQAAVDRVLQELARVVPSADDAIVGALDTSYSMSYD